MDKETIEQAADKYAESATPSNCYGDFDRNAIADAYEAGAEWRINSVWRDARKDYPTTWNLILTKNVMGAYNLGYEVKQDTVSWAYLKDLTPNKKVKSNMTNESYVSFEVAELLKKAGFDVPVYACCLNADQMARNDFPVNYNSYDSGRISCPTQDVAIKWLREQFQIHVFSTLNYVSRMWFYCIVNMKTLTAAEGMSMSDDEDEFEYYEQAIDSCLKKVLRQYILHEEETTSD